MSYPHKNACPRCKAAYKNGKPENFGSDVQCAFLTGKFSAHNWQCATMLKLRDINIKVSGSDYGQHKWNSDESVAVLVDGSGDSVLFSWYKRRGKVQWAMSLLDGDENTPLTVERAEAVIDFYKE